MKQDHRTVEQLFVQFEASRESSIADDLCSEIDLPAQVEEQAGYPVLRDEVSAEMANHAEERHAKARQLIGRIRQTKDLQHLAEVVGELKQAIEEHVQEEETEVFPKMEQVLGASRLDAMGVEVEQLKMQS